MSSSHTQHRDWRRFVRTLRALHTVQAAAQANTLSRIAADLKKKYDVTVLTHLTQFPLTREHVAAMVKKYKDAGIENICAAR